MRRAVMHLFTDDEKILSKLAEKGNPLERLDAVMDCHLFLPLLSEFISRGGRPHHDYLMMFKVLLLQRLHIVRDKILMTDDKKLVVKEWFYLW